MTTSPLCPISSPQEDQYEWIQEQILETLASVLEENIDNKYVLRQTAKVLRQRLRKQLNHVDSVRVPISQALSWINAQQSVEVLRQALNVVIRKSLKKRISERLQFLNSNHLQVGVLVTKYFQKPDTKKKQIYISCTLPTPSHHSLTPYPLAKIHVPPLHSSHFPTLTPHSPHSPHTRPTTLTTPSPTLI